MSDSEDSDFVAPASTHRAPRTRRGKDKFQDGDLTGSQDADVPSRRQSKKKPAKVNARVETMIRQGSIKYPFEVSKFLTLLNLGMIIEDPAYCNKSYIFPVNYSIIRKCKSYRSPNVECEYTCTITRGEAGPLFHVSPGDDPGVTYSGATPTAPWLQVVKKLGRKSVSGPLMFGLYGCPAIDLLLSNLRTSASSSRGSSPTTPDLLGTPSATPPIKYAAGPYYPVSGVMGSATKGAYYRHAEDVNSEEDNDDDDADYMRIIRSTPVPAANRSITPQPVAQTPLLRTSTSALTPASGDFSTPLHPGAGSSRQNTPGFSFGYAQPPTPGSNSRPAGAHFRPWAEGQQPAVLSAPVPTIAPIITSTDEDRQQRKLRRCLDEALGNAAAAASSSLILPPISSAFPATSPMPLPHFSPIHHHYQQPQPPHQHLHLHLNPIQQPPAPAPVVSLQSPTRSPMSNSSSSSSSRSSTTPLSLPHKKRFLSQVSQSSTPKSEEKQVVPMSASKRSKAVHLEMCFHCKQYDAASELVSCHHAGCKSQFHTACAKALTPSRSTFRRDLFVCPQHFCAICKSSENEGRSRGAAASGSREVWRCPTCPFMACVSHGLKIIDTHVREHEDLKEAQSVQKEASLVFDALWQLQTEESKPSVEVAN